MSKRYLPRAVFYEHEQPAHPEFLKELLSDEIVLQSTVRPGERDSIRWITLRPEDKVDDPGMPGAESAYSKYRPPVLLLDYDIRWKDTYNQGDWAYQPSPEEQDWRNVQMLTYTGKLFDLQQKQNPSDDDKDEIKSLEGLIGQLGTRGEGYLESAYNLLGSGATGITWGLEVANIPVTVTSTFLSQKNRGQSFRIKRLEKPEGQVNHSFTIEIGNGNSLYAIVIGDDGNSTDFIHYRNMSPGARKAKIKELDDLRDHGRLTVEDRGNIILWENQIKRIQYDAKKAGRHGKSLNDDETTSIERLKKQVNDLKESKRGLNEADKKDEKDLEKDLYIEREQFTLQEHSKNSIGKTVDFSVLFLASGYVVIQSEDGRKIYENKRMTGGIPAGAEPIFGDSLPAKAFITLKSDGGMWSLVYGNPRHDTSGSIWSQPFEIPFAFDMSEVEWLIEADSRNPGCLVTYELYTYRPSIPLLGFVVPGLYQIRIQLHSNHGVDRKLWGRYTPELYYVELHIPKAAITTTPEVVWDSDDPANAWPTRDKNRIMDMVIQDDRKRSRLCTLTIANGKEEANLPVLLGGKVCDTVLYDIVEDREIPVTTYGFTGKVNRGVHQSFKASGPDGIQVEGAHGNQPSIEVSGCEGFMDQEIQHPVTGNNRYVGDYLRILARDAGMPDFLCTSLPIGDQDGCPRIKRMKPGCFPDVKPAIGARFWEWMQDVVKKHAPRWELWTDGSGLRFTKRSSRRRTDVSFSTTAPIDSSQRLRRAHTDSGGLQPVQDLREYWTSATYVGAPNPLTGMRFTQTERIPQATDDDFRDSMFYTGIHNHYTGSSDESLRSDADCLAAAREHLEITPLTPQGLPPWSLRWKVDLDTTIRGGDMLQVNGIWYLIEGTEFGSVNSGNPQGQQMTMSGRLAEDKKVVLTDG